MNFLIDYVIIEKSFLVFTALVAGFALHRLTYFETNPSSFIVQCFVQPLKTTSAFVAYEYRFCLFSKLVVGDYTTFI